jgi:hypothetical protein
MRDKTCVRKFNGENPAEWLSIRKIGEDWFGCLELVLPGHNKNMTLIRTMFPCLLASNSPSLVKNQPQKFSLHHFFT